MTEFIILTHIHSAKFMKRFDQIEKASEIEFGKTRIRFTDGECFDVEESIEQILTKMKIARIE